MTDMNHMEYLEVVTVEDCAVLREKESTYKGSWKAAGGRSAWFMARRNMDRMLTMMAPPHGTTDILQDYTDHIHGAEESDGEISIDLETLLRLRSAFVAEDIFLKIQENPSGEDGTVLAVMRDMRRYLILVEAEMMSRGVVGGPHSEPVRRTVAATHDDLRRAATPVTTRIIDPEFDRVVSEGKIHERGKSPRPAHGEGCDGRIIRVGDACTCMISGLAAFDTRLIDVRADGLPAVEYGSAPGGLVVMWQELRRQPVEPAETRTVPRLREQGPYAPSGDTPSCGDGLFDTHARQRTTEDGAQHASLAPWVARPTWFMAKDISVAMREKFWNLRAPGTHVLEPHVISEALPRVLQTCYHMLNSDGEVSWILAMSRVPAGDARDMFPRLAREKNAVEHDELPAWQQRMYEWTNEKFVLRDKYAAWGHET